VRRGGHKWNLWNHCERKKKPREGITIIANSSKKQEAPGKVFLGKG